MFELLILLFRMMIIVLMLSSTVTYAEDADGDNISDNVDACLGTTLPDMVLELGTNRFADVDGDGVFETNSAQNVINDYSIVNTRGCSCEQIVTNLGLGKGHKKFGCSVSVMENWLAIVTDCESQGGNLVDGQCIWCPSIVGTWQVDFDVACDNTIEVTRKFNVLDNFVWERVPPPNGGEWYQEDCEVVLIDKYVEPWIKGHGSISGNMIEGIYYSDDDPMMGCFIMSRNWE